MFKKSKAVKITHIMVRIFYFVWAAVAIGAPFYCKFMENRIPMSMFLTPLYIALPVGLAALICLDKLMINIRKEIVFDDKNVLLLRILSCCCFLAAAVGAVFCVYFFFNASPGASILIAIVVMEIFVGLIVLVVGHVFDASIKIKKENELTI